MLSNINGYKRSKRKRSSGYFNMHLKLVTETDINSVLQIIQNKQISEITDLKLLLL